MREHYINGEWLSSDASTPNRNPSDLSDTIGLYAKADRAQAKLAIVAAAHAAKDWQHGSLPERANALDQVAGELRGRAKELGDLLAREQGKTLREAIAEVIRASDISILCRGGHALARRAAAVHASGNRCGDRTRASGCCRSDCTVKLSDRDTGVEDCPRACLREHRRIQAG